MGHWHRNGFVVSEAPSVQAPTVQRNSKLQDSKSEEKFLNEPCYGWPLLSVIGKISQRSAPLPSRNAGLWDGIPLGFSVGIATIFSTEQVQGSKLRSGQIPLLLRDEPEKGAAVGGRQCELLLQIGEIECGQIGHGGPILRIQIRSFLQDEIGGRHKPREIEVAVG